MPLFSCAGKRPAHLGRADAGLAPCPATPNCVSSDAVDAHHIAPFVLEKSPDAAWADLVEVVGHYPRTEIVTRKDDYLHAECATAVFGFVDDVEFDLRATDGIIAVRSASRLGSSDLGVNRRRVEEIRGMLKDRQSIR